MHSHSWIAVCFQLWFRKHLSKVATLIRSRGILAYSHTNSLLISATHTEGKWAKHFLFSSETGKTHTSRSVSDLRICSQQMSDRWAGAALISRLKLSVCWWWSVIILSLTLTLYKSEELPTVCKIHPRVSNECPLSKSEMTAQRFAHFITSWERDLIKAYK